MLNRALSLALIALVGWVPAVSAQDTPSDSTCWVAFHNIVNTNPEIALLGFDGEALTTETIDFDGYSGLSPHWSGDGALHYVESDISANTTAVYRRELGGEPTEVLRIERGVPIRFSPDAVSVVYDRYDSATRTQNLFIQPLEAGAAPTLIQQTDEVATVRAWHSETDRIMLLVRGEGEALIFVLVDASTGARTERYPIPAGLSFQSVVSSQTAWSPDGRWLAWDAQRPLDPPPPADPDSIVGDEVLNLLTAQSLVMLLDTETGDFIPVEDARRISGWLDDGSLIYQRDDALFRISPDMPDQPESYLAFPDESALIVGIHVSPSGRYALYWTNDTDSAEPDQLTALLYDNTATMVDLSSGAAASLPLGIPAFRPIWSPSCG
ncbi:MAG: hypothetical protein MUF38_11740 [Anaerolineae bacterium]|jgi:hypothetical protein|nr:hypothetical protein [Anaerolineae bacterium]